MQIVDRFRYSECSQSSNHEKIVPTKFLIFYVSAVVALCLLSRRQSHYGFNEISSTLCKFTQNLVFFSSKSNPKRATFWQAERFKADHVCQVVRCSSRCWTQLCKEFLINAFFVLGLQRLSNFRFRAAFYLSNSTESVEIKQTILKQDQT